jgi:hypothetical protein
MPAESQTTHHNGRFEICLAIDHPGLARDRRPNHVSGRHESSKHHLNKSYDYARLPNIFTAYTEKSMVNTMTDQNDRQ